MKNLSNVGMLFFIKCRLLLYEYQIVPTNYVKSSDVFIARFQMYLFLVYTLIEYNYKNKSFGDPKCTCTRMLVTIYFCIQWESYGLNGAIYEQPIEATGFFIGFMAIRP